MTDIVRRRLRFSYFELCLAILLIITIIRLIGLRYSVVDLFIDESQYWVWSREIALGYFSKPPLLAWAIAGADATCGSGESCVRALSPIFYFGTALLGYAIAREIYDERTAFWSALAIALAPAVAFSSRIVSTDVPLLFFWTLALFAYVKLLRGGGTGWAIALGVAFGLGLLAKYAMIYFLLGVAFIVMIDTDARQGLRRKEPWLALAIGVLLIAPNLIWNALHQFDTVRHTAGLVQLGSLGFKPGSGLEFVGAQFGVLGPIILGGVLVLLFRWHGPTLRREDRWMLAFAIPPLVLITALAFVNRAYANWAAPAFISAAIVVSAVLVRNQQWSWIKANIAIGLAAQALLLATDATADKITVSVLGRAEDPYRRSMGWSNFANEVRRIAQQTGADAIVGESRYEVASLIYYMRDLKPRVLVWPKGSDAENHFERTIPLTPAEGGILLLVTSCPSKPRLEKFYRTVALVGSFDSPSGPTTFRRYFAFKLSGSRGAIEPLGDCR